MWVQTVSPVTICIPQIPVYSTSYPLDISVEGYKSIRYITISSSTCSSMTVNQRPHSPWSSIHDGDHHGEWGRCFIQWTAFLQRVTIACYTEHCTSYSKSVRPSVRHTLAAWPCQNDSSYTIMRSSMEDSPMTLVPWRLTSVRNSKGNVALNERGVGKIGNF